MSRVVPEPDRVCAYCRIRPVDDRWAPFCSRRCRLLDLAAWVDGRYRMAGEPVSPETDATPTPEAEP